MWPLHSVQGGQGKSGTRCRSLDQVSHGGVWSAPMELLRTRLQKKPSDDFVVTERRSTRREIVSTGAEPAGPLTPTSRPLVVRQVTHGEEQSASEWLEVQYLDLRDAEPACFDHFIVVDVDLSRRGASGVHR
jgi:hypothetical protein